MRKYFSICIYLIAVITLVCVMYLATIKQNKIEIRNGISYMTIDYRHILFLSNLFGNINRIYFNKWTNWHISGEIIGPDEIIEQQVYTYN